MNDVTDLLRACLVALRVRGKAAAVFRVRLPFWSVADATARTRTTVLVRDADGCWIWPDRL